MADRTRVMTDTERLDWLEKFVLREGYILLHDGNNSHHLTGLGIGPQLGRDLRKAIDDCQRYANVKTKDEQVSV